MARLFEFVLIAMILYLGVRRIAAPFQRGYAEREAERQAERRQERDRARGTKLSRVDKTSVRDAEFKDIG